MATPKHLFFCHDPVALISKIKELRKIEVETENLVQGDTGQDWLKIGINVIKKNELESEHVVRAQAAGIEFATVEEEGEPGPSRKRIRRGNKVGLMV